MIPFKTIVQLNKEREHSLYLQLADQLIGLIKSGTLAPGAKLPGTRAMATALSVHRKTVIAAYEELLSQAWIEVFPSSGTFVSASLPVVVKQSFSENTPLKKKEVIGFTFSKSPYLHRSDSVYECNRIYITEGVPDTRLAPIHEIALNYRTIVKKAHNHVVLAYGSLYGNQTLREVLVQYLNDTRGLKITIDNILITRGSQMGIYLSLQLLLKRGGTLVVGESSYITADKTAREVGGKLLRIPVDREGIVTEALAEICAKQTIQAVYVTSHHHHPTTVTLSAKRRMYLLALAQQYNFAIVEDDYDYDFHYNNAPILPLASHDAQGNVIYTGALCKIVAPAIRVGYLVAPKTFIDAAAQLRAVIDRQGDAILEMSIARMIADGTIQRHSKKALKLYRKRRDLFCKLLQENLKEYLHFEIPEGGMAVWILLHKRYSWHAVAIEGAKLNLEFPDYRNFDAIGAGHNGIRLGFAAHTETELIEIIRRWKLIMEKLSK